MSVLSKSDIEQLWIHNGGDPQLADTMASIALAESGGNTEALNNNPSTGDYSVGLWQINYFAGLGPSRTRRYGSSNQLLGDPNQQAKAAVDLAAGGKGLGNWSTYTSGAWEKFASSGTVGMLTLAGQAGDLIGTYAKTGKGLTAAKPLQGSILGFPIGSYLKVAAGGVLLIIALVIVLAAMGLRSGKAEQIVSRAPLVGPAVKGARRRQSRRAGERRHNVAMQRIAERESTVTDLRAERAYKTTRAREQARYGESQGGGFE